MCRTMTWTAAAGPTGRATTASRTPCAAPWASGTSARRDVRWTSPAGISAQLCALAKVGYFHFHFL